MRLLIPIDLRSWLGRMANDPALRYLYVALERLGLGSFPREDASEFDNFYTPQNQGFYANYTYVPLDPGRREIRLLRVFPGKKSYHQHEAGHSPLAQAGISTAQQQMSQ